ncbi:MAG: 2-deoxyribose-5-phosphate aldolase, partial [Coprobacillus sp.]
MNYNKFIDHTALKPDTTKAVITKLCEEAKEYDFASVCVNPTWVKYCAEFLKETDVKVCTVIGFPLGANTTEVKAFEARNAI